LPEWLPSFLSPRRRFHPGTDAGQHQFGIATLPARLPATEFMTQRLRPIPAPEVILSRRSEPSMSDTDPVRRLVHDIME
jgi:hypothetical protein